MARMTKKDIYASFGIEYDNNGHILYNDEWIPELLKDGNTKTGKHVHTFSLPAGKEYSCVCDCIGCYAQVGRYNTDAVKESNIRNMRIVENNIDFFYRAISAQLATIGNGEIRIHASGDFAVKNMTEYAETWHRIVKENPSFLFWTYTKVRTLETLFDDLDNGNIVKSVIDGMGVNFGHCDYILKVYRKLKTMGASVYICRCGIDSNQHCENCGHCSKSDFVLFIEHSTEYNAKKDPYFEELKRVIDEQ